MVGKRALFFFKNNGGGLQPPPSFGKQKMWLTGCPLDWEPGESRQCGWP